MGIFKKIENKLKELFVTEFDSITLQGGCSLSSVK